MNAEDRRAVKQAVGATIARFGALSTSPQWTSVVKPAVQRHLRSSQIEEIVCYCLGNVNVREGEGEGEGELILHSCISALECRQVHH